MRHPHADERRVRDAGVAGLAPIETRYKGYRFRSRLEARWAVCFDALGLEWEYEPEGFRLRSRAYLPDFRVASDVGPFYAEVKATPRDQDWSLLGDLARTSLRPVVALSGMPEVSWYPVIDCAEDMWAVDLGMTARKGRLVRVWRERPGSWPDASSDALLRDAVATARSARFEHGETIHVPALWKRPITRAGALVAGAVSALLPSPVVENDPLCIKCEASYATDGTSFCAACRYDPFADEAP